MPADEAVPVGPSPEEETAFLEQERERMPDAVPVAAPRADAEESVAQLPPLDDLVKRVPPPTRALLDELFRARFVAVKRVPKTALKS